MLFHDGVLRQLQSLHAATRHAQQHNPAGVDADTKLFRTLSRLMLDTVPSNPSRDEYRPNGALGPDRRHWRRAEIGSRFRLYFRYDAKANLIVYVRIEGK